MPVSWAFPMMRGNSWRPGTRFGPRDIRTNSVRYSTWGGANQQGYWDINQQKQFLEGVRIVDCGDVDVAYYDIERNMTKITESVVAMLDRNVFPIIVGGDHSVTYPCIRAFERFGPLDIVQIDAHLDWVDAVEGISYANGSPMRRAMEHDFTRNMAQIGIRDVRSREHEYRTAVSQGSRIFTRQQVRERGVAGILDDMPELGNVYVSIDIDGLCPSIAPGTGSPTVDGLLYHEVRSLVQGLAQRGNVVGFDIVEVNPMVDVNGQTSLLASTLIIEFLGAVFDAKG